MAEGGCVETFVAAASDMALRFKFFFARLIPRILLIQTQLGLMMNSSAFLGGEP